MQQFVPSHVARLERLLNHAYLHNAEHQHDEEVVGSHFCRNILLNVRCKATVSTQHTSAVYMRRADNRET